MLLSHQQIQQEYDARYTGVVRSYLAFRPSSLTTEQIADVERRLSIILPPAFRYTILAIDFWNLQAGPAMFGFGPWGNYADYLAAINLPVEFPPSPWWSEGGGEDEGPRPSDFILIGNTDGHQLLLNLQDDSISASESGKVWSSQLRAATDIDLFLRAAGTAELLIFEEEEPQGDKEEVYQRVKQAVGADDASRFWFEVFYGSA